MKKNAFRLCGLVIAMILATQLNTFTSEAATGQTSLEWNGDDAAAYAKKFATSYNTAFHSWSKSDCTNFASQCLAAGHQMMTGGSLPKSGGNIETTADEWYYKSGQNKNTYACSTSWIRCSGKKIFATYWKKQKKGKYSSLANVRKNVSVGDVIQITLEDGTLKHSIIVVKKKDGEVYCASHTKDYKSDALEEINKRARDHWGDCSYTVFHF